LGGKRPGLWVGPTSRRRRPSGLKNPILNTKINGKEQFIFLSTIIISSILHIWSKHSAKVTTGLFHKRDAHVLNKIKQTKNLPSTQPHH
jgi:hypothetical protein